MLRQLKDKIVKFIFNIFYKEYVKANLYAELFAQNQILQKDLEIAKTTLKNLELNQHKNAIIYDIDKEEFNFIYEEETKEKFIIYTVAYILLTNPKLQQSLIYWASHKINEADYNLLMDEYENNLRLAANPIISPNKAWSKIVGKN